MEKEYCAMNLRLQILLLFLASLISSINATPLFTKLALPNYELSFSKIEYVKLEGDVKFGSSKIWEEFGKKGIVKMLGTSSNYLFSRIFQHEFHQEVCLQILKNLSLSHMATG
jgi:hypothetical protein